MSKTNSIRPEQVQAEYRAGVDYKRQLGDRGLYEQNRINERFYAGDQWYGVNCGDSRPLVRHNVIKRIGDYKMAVVGADPAAVCFAAEGVPLTPVLRQQVDAQRNALKEGGKGNTLTPAATAQLMASALTDYFATTAARLKLEDLKQRVLRNAYITGTGVLYTYWDDTIPTGLYADEARTTPICGDIAAEVLEVEQVYPGDPTIEDIQQQPYVIIAQRQAVAQLPQPKMATVLASPTIAITSSKGFFWVMIMKILSFSDSVGAESAHKVSCIIILATGRKINRHFHKL